LKRKDRADYGDFKPSCAVPAGTTPLVITYNASTVPILQLAMSGKTSEQQLFDYG
jgi:hypothetical protein